MAEKSRSDLNKAVYLLRDMLVSNKDLLKILYYDGVDDDVYEMPDLRPSAASTVVNTRILPYRKEFDDGTKCCYIVMTYGFKTYHQRNNHMFNGNTIEFYVLCDNSIVYNNYIGDKVNEIEEIIKDTYDNTLIEKINVTSYVTGSEPINSRSTNYSGRKIVISFVDVNKE